MMSKISKSFLSCFLVWCSITANAQVVSRVSQAFDNYRATQFREKIFVHTSKDTFLAGELIWFKIYTVNAEQQRINISKVAYVDVLDQNNNFILQAKIALTNGIGNGSFYIPKTISTGAFKLRAYTNWMKNFGPATFFEKQLNLINLSEKQENIGAQQVNYDVQFFPEGGDMVDGIATKIAFKITGKDGLGANLNGVIVNEQSDTVARFSALKFGMGSFVFKPLANHNYKAITKTLQNDVIIKQLPIVKKQGYVLSLTTIGDEVSIKIATNLPTNGAYLFIQGQGKLMGSQQLSFNNGQAEFKIKKQELNDGVSSFTLFNTDGAPVCERLYFKKPVHKLVIDAQTQQQSYPSRKPISINFSVKNELEQKEQGDFSVSVYQLDSLNQMPQADIVSYMLLEAEIKGNIESPSYYLLNDNPGANEALDNLLLTQGWRHFKWNEVLSQTLQPKYLPEFNDHLIAGKISQLNGDDAARKTIYVGVPGKRNQFYATLSDDSGQFLINTRDFWGTNELIIKNANEADSTLKINILSPFFEQFNKTNYTNLTIGPSLLNSLQNVSLSTELQNNYIPTKIRQFYSPNIDSASFYGKPYKTYLLDDYTRFPTMEDIFREYISEISVLRRQKHVHLKMVGLYDFLNEEPLVLLDGVPYTNMDLVMEWDPLKIKKLEVVRDRYYYGGTSFEGILSFTTANGDLGNQRVDPRAIVFDYDGLELQREFYSPVYETEAQLKSRIPDFRNLLYWSPEITVDEQGKAKINFYTSDQTGTYIGIIQGIGKSGTPGSKFFTFEVKK